jgi:8-oxo-dGTP diphosphatase
LLHFLSQKNQVTVSPKSQQKKPKLAGEKAKNTIEPQLLPPDTRHTKGYIIANFEECLYSVPSTLIMRHYARQVKMLLAVDCIVFGFDGIELKLLLIKRGFTPMKGRWSLMGGFVQPNEDADRAADRVIKTLTGLDDIYLEQLQTFTTPKRDPVERTASIAYLSLVNLRDYQQQLSTDYHAEWIPVSKLPKLIFDHDDMLVAAKKKLQEKATIQPIVFQLLPMKFTLRQLQTLYEQIFDTPLDKRNFTKKMLASKLLVQQKEKDKIASRRGAFYYKVDVKRFNKLLQTVL